MTHNLVKMSGYALILIAALLFSSDAIARGGGDAGGRAADFNPQRIFPVNSQIDNYYQYDQFNPNTQQIIYPKKQTLKNTANCIQMSSDGSCTIQIEDN